MYWNRIFWLSIVLFVSSLYSGWLWPLTAARVNDSVLAEHSMPLSNRYNNEFVNNVFKDNILLTLAYMSGLVNEKADINWEKVKRPFRYNFVLNPGEVFAFHDDVLLSFEDNKIMSTKAHFNSREGFLSDGYLYGDGVCHLASLINWAAIDAGLLVLAPTKHSFAVIPDIPEKYGVSIYSAPNSGGGSKMQNLYIKNIFNKPVIFAFNYKDEILNLTISKMFSSK